MTLGTLFRNVLCLFLIEILHQELIYQDLESAYTYKNVKLLFNRDFNNVIT